MAIAPRAGRNVTQVPTQVSTAPAPWSALTASGDPRDQAIVAIFQEMILQNRERDQRVAALTQQVEDLTQQVDELEADMVQSRLDVLQRDRDLARERELHVADRAQVEERLVGLAHRIEEQNRRTVVEKIQELEQHIHELKRLQTSTTSVTAVGGLIALGGVTSLLNVSTGVRYALNYAFSGIPCIPALQNYQLLAKQIAEEQAFMGCLQILRDHPALSLEETVTRYCQGQAEEVSLPIQEALRTLLMPYFLTSP